MQILIPLPKLVLDPGVEKAFSDRYAIILAVIVLILCIVIAAIIVLWRGGSPSVLEKTPYFLVEAVPIADGSVVPNREKVSQPPDTQD